MQQEAIPGLLIEGSGNCRHFTAGHQFTFDQHFNANGNYILTRIEHEVDLSGTYFPSSTPVGEMYRNRFQCIPQALSYRPVRKYAKPRINGLQKAVVVGPSGQEIFTDQYSRVKVQFLWDRLGKNDANSSCWIRVASFWAGKQWGLVHIPRIGQEVLVDFLEGDPDQPIIVGSVYNAAQMPPYLLPDNMTQSGLKSRSTLQGTIDQFNELRFEDKKGSEEIYFHAEKNFTRIVENNDLLQVGYQVKDGAHQSDDGSQTIKIYKDRTETLETGNETVTIAKGSRTHNIKTDDTLTVEGKQTITITGDQTITIKTGNRSVTISTGGSTTEAATSIVLKVGGNSITIDQAGITVKGTMISIQGQATLEAKSPMTTVKGDGMLTLKGGVTMIN
jgi:type VI secretion system secreted protein VgrG